MGRHMDGWLVVVRPLGATKFPRGCHKHVFPTTAYWYHKPPFLLTKTSPYDSSTRLSRTFPFQRDMRRIYIHIWYVGGVCLCRCCVSAKLFIQRRPSAWRNVARYRFSVLAGRRISLRVRPTGAENPSRTNATQREGWRWIRQKKKIIKSKGYNLSLQNARQHANENKLR